MKRIVFFIFICVVHTERFSFVRPTFDKFPTRACECGKSSVSRIIGGTEAPKLKYIWMTALCIKENVPMPMCRFQNQICGGSIINDYFVLTAAHCVKGRSADELIVNVGDWDLSTTGDVNSMQRNISNVIIHSRYSRRTLENDIALLKLKTAVVFSNDVAPICLPVVMNPQPTYDNEIVTVIGWGTTDPNQGVYPNILREVDVQVVPNADCSLKYGGNFFNSIIKPSMICASLLNKDSCYGDSGGPMAIKDPSTLKWTQIGIVSFGNGCADPNYPGVYTRVSSFIEWIKKNTNGADQCT